MGLIKNKTNTLSGLLLLISLVAMPTAFAKETIQITTFNTPFSTVIKAIVDEAYRRIGYSTQVLHLPGARALKLSGSGAVSAELYRIAAINKTYPDLVQVAVPLFNFEIRAFSKGLNFSPNSWQSLKPYKIGIMNGVKITEAHTAKMQRSIINSLHEMFTLLDNDRIDIALTTRMAGLITQKELKLDNIKMHSPAIYSFPAFHFVHKSQKHLIPLLQNALKKMAEQGQLQQIIDHELASIYNSVRKY